MNLLNQAVNRLVGDRHNDRFKADIENYKQEVDIIDSEHLSFQREWDEEEECRPTFEQLHHEDIIHELELSLRIIKSFEALVAERVNAFNSYLNGLMKSRPAFDEFQHCDGTIKQSLDTLYLFVDQESQQTRLQLDLSSLKQELTTFRTESKWRINDYKKQITNCEKDIVNYEKKLAKSKELHDKAWENKQNLDRIDYDLRNGNLGRRIMQPRERWQEQMKEAEESVQFYEKEIKDEISFLLRAYSERDKLSHACRRAYLKIFKESKFKIANAISMIVRREKDSHNAIEMALNRLESSVNDIDVDTDVLDFINSKIRGVSSDKGNKSNNEDGDGPLVLSWKALTTLNDHFHSDVVAPVKVVTSGQNYAAASRGRSRSDESHVTVFATARAMSPITRPISPISTSNNYNDHNHATALFSPSSNSSSASKSIIDSEPDLAELVEQHLTIIFHGYDDEGSDSTKYIEPNSVTTASIVANATNALRRSSSSVSTTESISRLSQIVKSVNGRAMFVSILNSFRSKKVNVAGGFNALGTILLETLDCCMELNEIHTAKTIMMLSQTFYRKIHNDDENINADESRAHNREYLKEALIRHPIWHDNKFWELVLWQLIDEQLHTMSYDTPWFFMDRVNRNDAVDRVHNIIFSQVMAIIHSMLEFKCPKRNIREFLYRMCVIYQLGENRRLELLRYLHSVDMDS